MTTPPKQTDKIAEAAKDMAAPEAPHPNLTKGRQMSDLLQPRNRMRELSIIFTIFGMVMLGTAVPRVFLHTDESAQFLQTGFIIFGIWLALILAAFFLSDRLLRNETDE